MPRTALTLISAALLFTGCDPSQQGAKLTCVAGMVDEAVREVAVVKAKLEHNKTAPPDQKAEVMPEDIDAMVELALGVTNKNLCERSPAG